MDMVVLLIGAAGFYLVYKVFCAAVRWYIERNDGK